MKTSKLWAIIVFIAGILEAIGIKSKKKDDTLSEYTWSKTKRPVMRGLVVGLVGWLVYHFSFGEGRDLGQADLLSAGIGVIIGVVSAFLRPKQP